MAKLERPETKLPQTNHLTHLERFTKEKKLIACHIKSTSILQYITFLQSPYLPNQIAPPTLSLVAPVTLLSTFSSSRHLSAPIRAITIASLNFTVPASGTCTFTINGSSAFSSFVNINELSAPPPVTNKLAGS